jgi:hypothetical protein
MTGYVRVEEQVEKDFDRALLRASLHRLRNHLRRRDSARDRLLSFDEAKGAIAASPVHQPQHAPEPGASLLHNLWQRLRPGLLRPGARPVT